MFIINIDIMRGIEPHVIETNSVMYIHIKNFCLEFEGKITKTQVKKKKIIIYYLLANMYYYHLIFVGKKSNLAINHLSRIYTYVVNNIVNRPTRASAYRESNSTNLYHTFIH